MPAHQALHFSDGEYFPHQYLSLNLAGLGVKVFRWGPQFEPLHFTNYETSSLELLVRGLRAAAMTVYWCFVHLEYYTGQQQRR